MELKAQTVNWTLFKNMMGSTVSNISAGKKNHKYVFFTATGSYPDLHYIKRQIPIAEVARELDLRVIGNTAHCWRPKNHKNGD